MLARWTWVHYCPSRQRWGRSAWALTNSHWPGLESRVPVLAVILVGHLPQNLNVALHGFNLEIPNRGGLQGEVLHWVSSSGHVLFWQRWSWSTLQEFAQCESSEPHLWSLCLADCSCHSLGLLGCQEGLCSPIYCVILESKWAVVPLLPFKVYSLCDKVWLSSTMWLKSSPWLGKVY